MSTFTLNNSVTIPTIGLGVFQSSPEDTSGAVASALEAGYRHIDTAASYGNEREVGQGLRASGLDRSEVFLETKLWISDYGYEQALHGVDKSADKLGVEQIDLLLLHQPLPSDLELTIGAYQALEASLANGRVRAIGVSNFLPEHLTALLERTEIVPAVNQIEVHPYAQPREPGGCASRRDPLLRRGRTPQRRRSGAAGDRRRARGLGGAGDAGLAPAAGTSGDPEVGAARADPRELRRPGPGAHRLRAGADR